MPRGMGTAITAGVRAWMSEGGGGRGIPHHRDRGRGGARGTILCLYREEMGKELDYMSYVQIERVT